MAHVFISYVRENSSEVDRLSATLAKAGINVWLDREDIQPGMRWQAAIRQAIREGAFFLACFSKEYHARSKTYMNEELTIAIDELRQRSRDTIWFIPLLLSGSRVPDWDIGAGETLASIQWVDLQRDWTVGVTRIISSISSSQTPGTSDKTSERHSIQVTRIVIPTPQMDWAAMAEVIDAKLPAKNRRFDERFDYLSDALRHFGITTPVQLEGLLDETWPEVQRKEAEIVSNPPSHYYNVQDGTYMSHTAMVATALEIKFGEAYLDFARSSWDIDDPEANS